VINGGRLDVSLSGCFDSFQSREEVDYYTTTLLKECLDEVIDICAKVRGQNGIHRMYFLYGCEILEIVNCG